MNIVAKVFDYEISSLELDREIEKIVKENSIKDEAEIRNAALSRVVDRYLLLHEAEKKCFGICDEEYESALLDIIDMVDCCDSLEDTLTIAGMPTAHVERLIKDKIIIKKFIHSLCSDDFSITEEEIRCFYEDQKEYFFREPEVRASHILVKGCSPESHAKITQMRAQINTPEEFIARSHSCSDCPSNAKCGDLGFFKKGTLLKEFDDVAFNLRINDISQPFKTQYGYHILMVTERRDEGVIPFQQIKDSLKARLIHIEKEYFLAKYIQELREKYKDFVKLS
jgi:parvulin-like peptidyl-prolyl isomerase